MDLNFQAMSVLKKLWRFDLNVRNLERQLKIAVEDPNWGFEPLMSTDSRYFSRGLYRDSKGSKKRRPSKVVTSDIFFKSTIGTNKPSIRYKQ